jgi:hypothetical protein
VLHVPARTAGAEAEVAVTEVAVVVAADAVAGMVAAGVVAAATVAAGVVVVVVAATAEDSRLLFLQNDKANPRYRFTVR